MIKSISILGLLASAVLLATQHSRADEFDDRAQAQAAAEADREDRQKYAKDLAEINGDNKAVLRRVRSLAGANGGSPRNLRCYEGLAYGFMRAEIGSDSEYTWTTMYGVPVGQRIVHVTGGSIIGEIAMSPFTIASALRGGQSEEPSRPQHSYPPFIGTCRFKVKNKVCSVVRYADDGGVSARCL